MTYLIKNLLFLMQKLAKILFLHNFGHFHSKSIKSNGGGGGGLKKGFSAMIIGIGLPPEMIACSFSDSGSPEAILFIASSNLSWIKYFKFRKKRLRKFAFPVFYVIISAKSLTRKSISFINLIFSNNFLFYLWKFFIKKTS